MKQVEPIHAKKLPYDPEIFHPGKSYFTIDDDGNPITEFHIKKDMERMEPLGTDTYIYFSIEEDDEGPYIRPYQSRDEILRPWNIYDAYKNKYFTAIGE